MDKQDNHPRAATMKAATSTRHSRRQVPVAIIPAREDRDGETEARPIRTVVVDDSPLMLKTLSLLLEQQGGVELIGTSTDGRLAMRRLAELSPNLVLMDLQLPGMNGLEVTRWLKAQAQAPAVIILTAEDTPEHRAGAQMVGADGFVAKQHLWAELPVAIRKLFPRATVLMPGPAFAA